MATQHRLPAGRLSRQRKWLSVKTSEKLSILGTCVSIIYKHWQSYHQMTDVSELPHDSFVATLIEIPQQPEVRTW